MTISTSPKNRPPGRAMTVSPRTTYARATASYSDVREEMHDPPTRSRRKRAVPQGARSGTECALLFSNLRRRPEAQEGARRREQAAQEARQATTEGPACQM